MASSKPSPDASPDPGLSPKGQVWMPGWFARMTPDKRAKVVFGGILACVLGVNVDFLFRHFGHDYAWHSPLWLVSVSLEAVFIALAAFLRPKKLF
jgi:lipopolysaccharide export LptBFGC system permease protein LptF